MNQEAILETDDPVYHYIRIPMRANVVSRGGIYPNLLNLGKLSKSTPVFKTLRLSELTLPTGTRMTGDIKWIEGSMSLDIIVNPSENIISLMFTRGNGASSKVCAGTLSILDEDSKKVIDTVGLRVTSD